MRQLIKKPVLFGLLLTLPLWPLLGNGLVALCVGFLLAFFIAMIDAIFVLRRHDKQNDNESAQTPPDA